jgi:general secretion pathway protein C
MEQLFKKYFWTVNVLFVLLAALLAAKTANLLVEAAIAPAPAATSVRASGRVTTQETFALLNAEALARLTGLPLRKPEEKVENAPTFDPNAAPVRTSLPLKWLGSLVASEPAWSVASILDVSTQRTGTYLVGDQVMTATVVEIDRNQVIINNNGRKEIIDDTTGTGVPPPQLSTAVAVKEPGTNVTGAGIKALSENDYAVPRSEVDKALSNLNDIAMQARIVPAFKDGQAEGFKLFSIRPDSLYSKIGIQNGDVIKRINGFDMNSPEKALEIYSKLKDATRIEIDVDRNGAPVHKTYNIN